MDWKILTVAFSTVFLAEIGDKTNLAVMTLAASSRKPWEVFAGAAGALVLITAIGAAAGRAVAAAVPEAMLHRLAGAVFVAIGGWLIVKG